MVQGPFDGWSGSWAISFKTSTGKSWNSLGFDMVCWNLSLFLAILRKKYWKKKKDCSFTAIPNSKLPFVVVCQWFSQNNFPIFS